MWNLEGNRFPLLRNLLTVNLFQDLLWAPKIIKGGFL
jgi:hypothetical protein